MSNDGTSLWFAEALLETGWAPGVRLQLRDGAIVGIEADVARASGEEGGAVALPGLVNVHSHAFQRAMAGLTERRGPSADDFWSWRELMYRFLDRGGAEEIEVPENHVGFVAIEGGRWPAAVVVPEKADEIEADLGTGKGAELFGHVGAETRQPAGMARTVVRARRALAGRPEPFGGRERVSAWRWLRGGGLDEEQQNQRKGRFHVHIFKD